MSERKSRGWEVSLIFAAVAASGVVVVLIGDEGTSRVCGWLLIVVGGLLAFWHLPLPGPPVAARLRLVALLAAAGLFAVAILDLGVLGPPAAELFGVTEKQAVDAEVWIRVGLATVAFLLLLPRGSWLDVVVLLSVVLVAGGVREQFRDTRDLAAKAKPKQRSEPTAAPVPGEARLLIPKAKITPPVRPIACDQRALLVALVEVRDAEADVVRTEERPHAVTLLRRLPAGKLTADLVVDLNPVQPDELARAVRDLETASRIFVFRLRPGDREVSDQAPGSAASARCR